MRPPRFLRPDFVVDRRADGTICLRSTLAVTPGYPHVPELLRQRAARFPQRVVLAQRGAGGGWDTMTYAHLEELSNRVASSLLDSGCGPSTPMLILSGNSIRHAVMLLGAMKARVPVAPVSVAYSLMDADFGKLRRVADITGAKLAYAEGDSKFEAAIRAISSTGVRHLGDAAYDAAIAHPVSERLRPSIDAIGPATHAKYLFTSGSTGTPKAVVHTQGMLAAQIASVDAIRQTHDEADGVPISLNWMPWSHVSAGNMGFHENLLEAGSLHLDDGRPLQGFFEETLRNLREISPTLYGAAPIAYAWLAEAMEKDAALRHSFFRNLQSMIYGGAALPLPIYERMQALAVAETGHRIPFMSVYGSTECGGVTLTYEEDLASGMIGLPAPGIEIKLVPSGDKLALCVRGESIFSEYLGEPALTRASFDEEGYFRTGDAARFLDESRPLKGLLFDGRLTEDFKLTTGTWVAAGNVRLELLAATGKLLADLVVCGENRPYLTVLAWLNAPEPDAAAALSKSISAYNARHPGSSTRIRRLMLLDEPPSPGRMEVNEKGSLNAKAVIANRAGEVEKLYLGVADPRVIEFDPGARG